MENTVCEYYSNIVSRQVDWLWYPYILFGKLTVLQGDPEEGKSTFVLNIVALLTQGRPMPDGYELQKPGVALYQCAEDGMADTIKPRLEKAGQIARELRTLSIMILPSRWKMEELRP